MRTRIGWIVLAVLGLGAPSVAQAQYYEVPPAAFTGFWSHPRYEDGGVFVGLDFLFMRQNNVLRNQRVAERGFVVFDNSIPGIDPGAYVGSHIEALNVEQVAGPGSYQPGCIVYAGWRFQDGITITASWWHLADNRRTATASLAPPDFNVGPNLENTYLFSPVVNFPVDYAGNAQNIALGNPGATFGIWNAASNMQIEFLQRFDMADIQARMPIFQNECYRSYGMFGPRAVIMWERFKWRTVDLDLNGLADDTTQAEYTNVVSNRLYGAYVGMGHEWKLGETPVGVFSFLVEADVSLSVDFVKERVKYQRVDRSTAATRARNEYTMAPGAHGKFGFIWYPYEGITFHAGWDALGWLNTVASPRPIDFNYGTIDPAFEKVPRLFHGIMLGITIVF